MDEVQGAGVLVGCGQDGATRQSNNETLDEYKPPHCLMVMHEGRANCTDNHFLTMPTEQPPPELDLMIPSLVPA